VKLIPLAKLRFMLSHAAFQQINYKIAALPVYWAR